MIPDDRTENMEPPECNADDPWFCETCGSVTRDENPCAECQREADEINGIHDNGTEEIVKIALPKFKTLDGRGTCGLDPSCDHLFCPLLDYQAPFQLCAWTGATLTKDDTGYLRPCRNCPIHKSP